MKLLLVLLILCSSLCLSANAACIINFENDFTEHVPTHRLFKYVKENENILTAKGYQLVGTDTFPRWLGSIVIEVKHNRKSLYMLVYDFDTETEVTIRTPYVNERRTVQNLLKKMPQCRE